MALAWGDGAWGDNAWGGGETFPVSVTETALLADAPAAGLLIDVSITESLTGGTAWGEGAWGSGSWSGTSGIQDVQTVALTMNVAVDESAAIAEDQSVVANFAGSVTETAAIADTNEAITSYNVSVTDTQTITDNEAAQTSYNESVEDSLGIVSVEEAVATFLGNISESIEIAEAQVAVLIMTIVESMAIEEGTTVGTYYQEFLTETAGIAEVNGGAANYNLSASDTMKYGTNRPHATSHGHTVRAVGRHS